MAFVSANFNKKSYLLMSMTKSLNVGNFSCIGPALSSKMGISFDLLIARGERIQLSLIFSQN